MRRLLVFVGGVGLVGLLGVGAIVAWGAWRIATYEQADDAGSLARKAAELEWMRDAAEAPAAGAPNVVLILFDDLGHGDVGAFGGGPIATPRMDALAEQGIALDHYYAAAPVCTPSRAGLLTGRWPIRTTLPHVVFPTGAPIDRVLRLGGRSVRLPADEITLAEALRAGGFATAMVGKWHLGDHAPSLPRDFGFESYLGLLYSNDMTPLALWQDEEIVAPDPVDQTTLTPRYTEAAVDFIDAHAAEPFFLYLAHTFPHLPLHATPGQAGRSAAGLYGDVVEDLDASVGEVLDALERAGVADRTLVIVTSDNGPWFQGSPGATRGRKSETFEGGMRVPFIARWPGRIASGRRSDAVTVAIDLFPTLLAAAGVPLPRDRVIDGVDLAPLLFAGEDASALPERPVLYYDGAELTAVRVGRYKWHDRHGIPYGRLGGLPLMAIFTRGPWLFDLAADPGESYDVRGLQPGIAARLESIARTHAAELARSPRGWRH